MVKRASLVVLPEAIRAGSGHISWPGAIIPPCTLCATEVVPMQLMRRTAASSQSMFQAIRSSLPCESRSFSSATSLFSTGGCCSQPLRTVRCAAWQATAMNIAGVHLRVAGWHWP